MYLKAPTISSNMFVSAYGFQSQTIKIRNEELEPFVTVVKIHLIPINNLTLSFSCVDGVKIDSKLVFLLNGKRHFLNNNSIDFKPDSDKITIIVLLDSFTVYSNTISFSILSFEVALPSLVWLCM